MCGHLNRIRALDSELPDGADSDRLRANARAFLIAVGWRTGADRDSTREIFEESVAAATRARDDRLLAQVQIAYGIYIGTAGGRFDEAAELASDCLQTARRSGDLELTAMAQIMVGFAYGMAGRFPEALDAVEVALELTVDQSDSGAGAMLESPHGVALQERAQVLAALGRPVKALRTIDDAEAFLRGRGSKETLCRTPWYRLMALQAAGADIREGEVAFAREALAIAEAISGPNARAVCQTTLAMAYHGVGRFTESLDTVGRAIMVIESSGTGREHEPLARYIRALALTAADCLVEPTMSVNNTVASTRSSSRAATVPVTNCSTASTDLSTARHGGGHVGPARKSD